MVDTKLQTEQEKVARAYKTLSPEKRMIFESLISVTAVLLNSILETSDSKTHSPPTTERT